VRLREERKHPPLVLFWRNSYCRRVNCVGYDPKFFWYSRRRENSLLVPQRKHDVVAITD
jgi:hypothetical protein